MEKERGTKLIATFALVLAIIGLSVGFAAYSRNLDINTLEGTITTADTELDVFFDNNQTKGDELGNVKGTGTAAVTDEVGAAIANGTLNATPSSNPTISGFVAEFSEKGQEVEYTFYVYNNSPHKAYLESAAFLNGGSPKTCTAIDEVDETNKENACDEINLHLEIDGKKIVSTDSASFETHVIEPGAWKEVVVRIAYDGTEHALPDGDVKVTFDGIRLSYTTIEQSTQS